MKTPCFWVVLQVVGTFSHFPARIWCFCCLSCEKRRKTRRKTIQQLNMRSYRGVNGYRSSKQSDPSEIARHGVLRLIMCETASGLVAIGKETVVSVATANRGRLGRRRTPPEGGPSAWRWPSVGPSGRGRREADSSRHEGAILPFSRRTGMSALLTDRNVCPTGRLRAIAPCVSTPSRAFQECLKLVGKGEQPFPLLDVKRDGHALQTVETDAAFGADLQ